MATDPRAINPWASQISLLHLDPQPIGDNASIYEKDLPPLPEEESQSSSRIIRPQLGHSTSLGLSGGGRGPIFYCKCVCACVRVCASCSLQPIALQLLLTELFLSFHSIPNPTLLILHIYSICWSSCCKYLLISSHIPIRSLLRTFSSYGT